MMKELIEGLSKPEAYEHEVKEVKVIQTAVSVVFLTGKWAYKVCKPLKLGFLDFSTLEKRKRQCEEEVRYNKLICPEVYEGVVEVRKKDGKIKIGGEGEVIEYAIKMKELDQGRMMSKLLEKGQVSREQIKEIARIVADFHRRAEQSEEISGFGKLKTIKFNWEENFEQTKDFKGIVIEEGDFDFIKEKVDGFMEKNKDLFEKRVRGGKIKQGHGDLHSGNVFLLEKPYIFDAIVFNKRFPCCDVAADIAFMAMDLEAQGREDFSKLFVEEYVKESGDEEVGKLLDFYKCYRAYIRGKINCFMLKDEGIGEEKKEGIKEKARKYFELAKRYSLSL